MTLFVVSQIVKDMLIERSGLISNVCVYVLGHRMSKGSHSISFTVWSVPKPTATKPWLINSTTYQYSIALKTAQLKCLTTGDEIKQHMHHLARFDRPVTSWYKVYIYIYLGNISFKHSSLFILYRYATYLHIIFRCVWKRFSELKRK